MGKHTKKTDPLARRSREFDLEPQEDTVDFDLIDPAEGDLDGDILDLDSDSILAEFFPEDAAPAPEEEAKPEPPKPEAPKKAETPAAKKSAEEVPSPAGKTEDAPRKKRPPEKKRTLSPAARAKRELARSRRRFRRGLTAYVLILLALIIGTLVYEWYALGKSQARFDAEAAEEAARKAAIAEQQAHEKAVYRAPQLAFENWKAGVDAAYWTDLWYAGKGDTLDPREAVTAYMTERFA